MSEPPKHHVADVLARLDALADRERMSLDDILQAFGRTSFLPMLLVPALLVISPLSGIPGFSSLCGLTIALISLQMLARRQSLWLPALLTRRTISGARVHGGALRLRYLADLIDRTARDRLQALTTAPLSAILHGSCMLCGLAMPFLEVVPFSSSILGCAVVFFVVALLARDGLFALFGWAMMLLAAGVPMALFGGIVATQG